MVSTIQTGRRGEDIAVEYLREAGYLIASRNWRSGRYEIDIVAEKDGVTHLVEVKTRHTIPGVTSRYGRPAAAIDQGKRARMRKAAEDYLRQHPTSLQPRIDVAEVYLCKGSDGADFVYEIKIFPAAYAGR